MDNIQLLFVDLINVQKPPLAKTLISTYAHTVLKFIIVGMEWWSKIIGYLLMYQWEWCIGVNHTSSRRHVYHKYYCEVKTNFAVVFIVYMCTANCVVLTDMTNHSCSYVNKVTNDLYCIIPFLQSRNSVQFECLWLFRVWVPYTYV